MPFLTKTKPGAEPGTYPRAALERVLQFAALRDDVYGPVLDELARLPLAASEGQGDKFVRLYGPLSWSAPPGWPVDPAPVAAVLVVRSTVRQTRIGEHTGRTFDAGTVERLAIHRFDDLFRAHYAWTQTSHALDATKGFKVAGWPTGPSGDGYCRGCGARSETFTCDQACAEQAERWKRQTAPKQPLVPARPAGPSAVQTSAPAPDPTEVGLAAAEARATKAVAELRAREADVARLAAENAGLRAQLEELRVDSLRRRVRGA